MSTFSDDNATRKSIPIFDGAVMYFPDALAAVAVVSRIGNDQHNPGESMHWARDKSMDQFNTALRHLIDHKRDGRYDAAGMRRLAQAAWRVLAALQLDIEAEKSEAVLAHHGIAPKPTDHHHIDTLRVHVSAFPPAPCFDTFGSLDRAVDEMLALPQNGSSKTGEDI